MDANRHLANSAYINFMSHTRMGFLMENGFGHGELVKHNLGPVVFYEHIYYFREVFGGRTASADSQYPGPAEKGDRNGS